MRETVNVMFDKKEQKKECNGRKRLLFPSIFYLHVLFSFIILFLFSFARHFVSQLFICLTIFYSVFSLIFSFNFFNLLFFSIFLTIFSFSFLTPFPFSAFSLKFLTILSQLSLSSFTFYSSQLSPSISFLLFSLNTSLYPTHSTFYLLLFFFFLIFITFSPLPHYFLIILHLSTSALLSHHTSALFFLSQLSYVLLSLSTFSFHFFSFFLLTFLA